MSNEPLHPVVTEDDDSNPLPYAEACRRSAQVYREEADTLGPGDYRDSVIARAEAFEEQAAQGVPPPQFVHAARAFIRPLDGDGEPTGDWTELEGITDINIGHFEQSQDTISAAPITMETTVELSEEARNEIAAMTDAPARVPNKLIYASDVVPGMRVLYPRPCPGPHGFIAMMAGGAHDHGRALADVLQVRQGEGAMGHIFSAIVLDEDGEQQSMTWHSVEAVRIAV